jgi:hypothetical protein
MDTLKGKLLVFDAGYPNLQFNFSEACRFMQAMGPDLRLVVWLFEVVFARLSVSAKTKEFVCLESTPARQIREPS